MGHMQRSKRPQSRDESNVYRLKELNIHHRHLYPTSLFRLTQILTC